MSTNCIIDDLRKKIELIETRGFDCANTHEHNVAHNPLDETLGHSSPSSEDDLAVQNSSEPDDGSSRAFKKIVSLVNHSDRSEKAIRERLSRDGYCDGDIDIAVQRALDCGFIDDLRFAEVLVRSRIAQSKGTAGIMRELSNNGIEATDIPGWPYEFGASHEEELDRALSYLRKKPPHTKNLREGAFRKLMQRGYSSDVASSAARIFSDEARG